MTPTRHLRLSQGVALVCLLSLTPAFGQSGSHRLTSPNGKTEVVVAAERQLTIAIFHNKQSLLSPSPVAMEINGGGTLGSSPSVESASTRAVDEKIVPVVAEKRKVIPDTYNELRLQCAGGYTLLVRAYNDGIAYRFQTALPGEIIVRNERLDLHLSADDSIWFPEETSFLSHSERQYALLPVRGIADTQMCCLPAVVVKPGGIKMAITEADLLDYPGLYLKGAGSGEAVLHAVLPAYPMEEELVGDRTMKVTKRAPYIARTRGTRDFPWRVFAIAEEDGNLIENDIVYRLGSPTVLAETSWIRPGKVAWDWWNANNISGVNFKSGINTNTYKYYIDFASRYRIEYVIFDEGWSRPSNLFEINPAMDMDALFAHAKHKGVGIILWVTWKALDDRLEEALDHFVQWGAKGIKVDFMQRDDQKMVNYYEKVAREAARRHLLVDFHGSYKPTGLSRTYPNVITREGVRGLEHSKWSADITPRHDVTLPFTRMFAGAMDFTPGAMNNAAKGMFQPIFEQPMSQGTRCHQLAMYVVYESPLQMLCDCPSNYLREGETMRFLATVPTTWDETRVLNGAIGEYVTVARRKGNSWYIGSMTNWTPRDFSLNLGFLGKGKWEITVYQDGINADRRGSDYLRQSFNVDLSEPLKVHLAPGGGFAATLSVKR
jgi:alpha-glucosidase